MGTLPDVRLIEATFSYVGSKHIPESQKDTQSTPNLLQISYGLLA